MKLMKKVLVLALATATILLAACDNGNGGEPSSGSPDTPTLPANKGTDPFDGLKTITVGDPNSIQCKVDTQKNIITEEKQQNTRRTPIEYAYSYDGEINPPTVTLQTMAIYDDTGTRVPIADYLATLESIYRKNLTETITLASSEQERQEIADWYNTFWGLTLTAADFEIPKINDTVEKIWNSPGLQDEMRREKEKTQKKYSQVATYIVNVKKGSATPTITIEGQYDSKYQWYEQPAGGFIGTISPIHCQFSFDGEYISASSTEYSIISVTENTIECKSKSGSPESFPYTTSGSGKDMVVTVDVDGTKIECRWNPAKSLPSEGYY